MDTIHGAISMTTSVSSGVTSQAPVRRVDEFLVDLETSGPAAQAPGRENRGAGAGEGIDDHSVRG
jgi:hypothetical protein